MYRKKRKYGGFFIFRKRRYFTKNAAVNTGCFSRTEENGSRHFPGGKCMSFGQRLKQLIRENDISQRQLSRDLNMAPTTLSGYANDRREPNFHTLIQFADYFQVSVDYLIGYSDNPSHS